MKSFLCKGKKPIIKWGMLPDNIFFEGEVPDGYKLAICPSEGYIIIDVDRHGKKDGFTNIPQHLLEELNHTLSYPTKNDGRHYWCKYSGSRNLMNKASNLGIDLRTNRGYVIWYKENDIRSYIDEVKDTSVALNTWLETLFI